MSRKHTNHGIANYYNLKEYGYKKRKDNSPEEENSISYINNKKTDRKYFFTKVKAC